MNYFVRGYSLGIFPSCFSHTGSRVRYSRSIPGIFPGRRLPKDSRLKKRSDYRQKIPAIWYYRPARYRLMFDSRIPVNKYRHTVFPPNNNRYKTFPVIRAIINVERFYGLRSGKGGRMMRVCLFILFLQLVFKFLAQVLFGFHSFCFCFSRFETGVQVALPAFYFPFVLFWLSAVKPRNEKNKRTQLTQYTLPAVWSVGLCFVGSILKNLKKRRISAPPKTFRNILVIQVPPIGKAEQP